MRSHKSRTTATLTLLAALGAAAAAQAQNGREPERPYTTWRTYGGGGHSSQYSALDQIDKSNVAQLEVAWSFPVGERSFVFNPIVVDNVMYVLARDNEIVALDAATGRELWARPHEGPVSARGINFWQSADGSDRRLLYLNAGMLTAFNARTGATITTFGKEGRVDLRDGLAASTAGTSPSVRPLHTSNPGRVIGNLMVVSLPAQGAGYASTPGDVQAYDVVTGKLAWMFHSIPHEGEFGYDTWPKGAQLDGGRRAQLERDDRRRRERHRVHPVRHGTLRLLRRQSRTATTFTRTRSSRSTRATADASGISSSCTTICGTTTCRRRRSS